MVVKKLVLGLLVCGLVQSGLPTTTALAAGHTAAAPPPVADPLEPFNQAMFRFNLTLDEYLLRPVAGGYAAVLPLGARQGVARFFRNLNVAPRVGNKLLQLELAGAGTELTRFLINTTAGGLGFFDVADRWFGLEAGYADFGQTLAKYGVGSGPYLVLPFFGPSTVRDAVGLGVDGAMQPINYLLPTVPEQIAARSGWLVGATVNARALNLELFESVDRFSLDLYGAVQDGYLQRREQVIRDAVGR